MKVCSICLKCYDDSIETCPAEDRETLTRLRRGDCLVIEGYRIGSQIESDSPVVRFRATHLASGKNVFAKFIKSGGSASELEAEMRAAHREDPDGKRPDWSTFNRCDTCDDDEALYTATDTGERDDYGDATWKVTCDECGHSYKQYGGGYGDEDDCTEDDEYPAGYFDV